MEGDFLALVVRGRGASRSSQSASAITVSVGRSVQMVRERRLATRLLSKQRQNYILKRPVKLCNAIGLQADVDTTSEHENLLDCSG